MDATPTLLPLSRCSLELPIATVPPPFVARHVEVHLTLEEATTLRQLADGLRQEHAQLEDGRHVDSAPQAIRFIAQQLTP